MNCATIKKADVANGPGIRVSLFVSGCTHACKGCFNSEAWDFHYGQEFTEETEKEIQVRLEEAKASLQKANEKAQGLTIKKLTERSPSRKAKFEAIDKEADS